MKNVIFAMGIVTALTTSLYSQKSLSIDLKEENLDVFNRAMTPIREKDHAGIRLSKDEGEGVAWLKGIEFSNGVIEFDVRGENAKQHSFVGIAFHGKNNETFDAIYLRPFQFQEQDTMLRNRSLQYIALPENTWRVLRAKAPGKYESSIDPSPLPDSWVHIRLVVQGSTVSTFVNGNKRPSLVVEKVNQINSGRIGFYVADTSGGDFANLRVAATE